MYNFKDYVRMIPEGVYKLLKDEQFVKKYQSISKYHKICFLGVGSSYNAATLASYFINSYTDKITSVRYASEFYFHINPDADTLYIIISQSGNSVICQQALNKVQQANCLGVVMTYDLTSSLASQAQLVLPLLMIKEEVAFKSLGYMMSTLELMLLFIPDLFGTLKAGQVLEELRSCYIATEQFLLTNHQQNSKIWSPITKVNLIGEGGYYWAFGEIALKIIEMVNIDSWVCEIEEYFHGEYLGNKKGVLNIVYATTQHEKVQQIHDYLTQFEGCEVLDLSAWSWIGTSHNQILETIKLIISLQLLVADLNSFKGLDPNYLSSRSLVQFSKSK